MTSEKLFKYLYVIIALTYISGIFMPLMENDSAQHAVMSMRIFLSDNFLDLQRGNDPYLDKPHMHFWLSALSYKIFGISEWAYRLPSLLFTVLGAFSVYKLAKELYGKQMIAHVSTLVFLSSQTIFLANHDVRTDAVLTGATIFSIWQLHKYISNQRIANIILGALGLGISFSTKGLYGPMIVFFAIIPQLWFSKGFKILLSYKTMIGLVTFLLTISPVLYAYYVQFGEAGVEFILWKQNIDRASANNLVPNNSDYFFFFHSILWLFFPWSLLLYFGVFKLVQKWIKNKFKTIKMVEILTLSGIFIPLFILSFSQFKLPHYVNPLIPLMSILTAGFLFVWYEKGKQKIIKVFLIIQYVLIPFLLIGIGLILFFVFSKSIGIYTSIAILIALFFLGFSVYLKKKLYIKLMIVSVSVMVLINTVLNLYFYPNLLEYQAGLQLAKIIKKKNIDPNTIYIIDDRYSWTLDFYTQRNTPAIDMNKIEETPKDIWIFIDQEKNLDQLKSTRAQIIERIEVNHFRVSKLNLKFMNPNTRASKLKKAYLVRVKS